jgi:hypothetical protein
MPEFQSEAAATPMGAPAASPWDIEFDRLRGRFPRVKDSILFCLHALQQDANVQIDDLKARSVLQGIRVTGQSMNAAKRILQGGGGARPRSRAGKRVDASTSATAVATPEPASDLERLIWKAIAEAKGEAGVAAERLRSAMRSAIEVLQAALRGA